MRFSEITVLAQPLQKVVRQQCNRCALLQQTINSSAKTAGAPIIFPRSNRQTDIASPFTGIPWH
jgi:hypothetical protein